jgi:hypothetical protein
MHQASVPALGRCLDKVNEYLTGFNRERLEKAKHGGREVVSRQRRIARPAYRPRD